MKTAAEIFTEITGFRASNEYRIPVSQCVELMKAYAEYAKLTRPVVTEEEIDCVIDDVCVLEECLAMEYQRDHPRAFEIDKLRERQRKAIKELLNQNT